VNEPVCVKAVLSVAVPLARATVPSTVLPFVNCTLPLAAGRPVGTVTAAVSVTVWFTPEGFGEELRLTEVAALCTVCTNTAEVLAAWVESPL